MEISVSKNGRVIRFVDLFAGIGGIRRGFENALKANGLQGECVLTSEIKPHALKVLAANYPNEIIAGDITRIDERSITDFDILLAGFPCQAFSNAGKRLGFQDTRGTLFFEIERILKEKRPFGFILENVEGLVTHDREDSNHKQGRTLTVILSKLNELGYNVTWRLLNAKDFGLAQDRRRIYITGVLAGQVSLDDFPVSRSTLKDILEQGKPTIDSPFIRQLLRHYDLPQLYGKAVKDKRGGEENIHSWDFGLKGEITHEQKRLLNMMLHERRKKKWAEMHGIKWMDGMPLTEDMIREFYQSDNLHEMLEDLVEKGYVKKEHPKALVTEQDLWGTRQVRMQDKSKPAGYNIVAGKMSFEINKILDPEGITPTLVAMDMNKNFVVDGEGLRPMTLREGLRLFGYPEEFLFPVTETEGYDLLGNTVAVPVITAVADRLIRVFKKFNDIESNKYIVNHGKSRRNLQNA